MQAPSRRLITSFRVYATRRTLYYTVFVWPTKRAMQYWVKNAVKGATLAGRRGNFEAICCSNTVIKISKDGKARTKPSLGQIHFYRKSLTMGIITHESGHAALAYCRRMGINVNRPAVNGKASDGEEDFCWVLGNIARGIVAGVEKVLWPKTPNRA